MSNSRDNHAGAMPVNRRDLLKGAAAGAFALTGGRAFAAERAIRIGLVTPKSGPLAPCAGADDYVLAALKPLFAKGVSVAGVTHPVEVVVKDSQSNPRRAAEVAAELIDKDKVDLLIAAGTADTTNPTADQAEANGVPCITTDTPWEAHFFGRRGDPKKGFDWTWHYFWGLKQISDVYTGIWGLKPTNKTVGALWSNDPDGAAVGKGVTAAAGAAGFKIVDAGFFTPGASDYSAQIAKFKQANVEILTGLFIPPDFSTFWTQAAQQGFKPKIVTVAKALLFPQTVGALGDRGPGLTTELWWSPYSPFKSSLTGESAAQLCAAWEKTTKSPWTPPLGFKHSLFEVALDVFSRAKGLSPEQIRDAIKQTKMQTIVGLVDFTVGPVPNIAETPLVGGQWVKGGAFGLDEKVIFDKTAPEIKANAELQLLG